MRNVEKEISFPTTGVKEKKIPIKKKKKTRVKKNTKIYPQQIVLALLKLKESILFYVNSTELRYEKTLTLWMVEMGGYI